MVVPETGQMADGCIERKFFYSKKWGRVYKHKRERVLKENLIQEFNKRQEMY